MPFTFPAWRKFEIDPDGRLASPASSASTGNSWLTNVDYAVCDDGHVPPHPTHNCGLFFWRDINVCAAFTIATNAVMAKVLLDPQQPILPDLELGGSAWRAGALEVAALWIDPSRTRFQPPPGVPVLNLSARALAAQGADPERIAWVLERLQDEPALARLKGAR